MFKQHKTKQLSSGHRNRVNVLKTCQQKIGVYTKFGAGYGRDTRIALPLATLNKAQNSRAIYRPIECLK